MGVPTTTVSPTFGTLTGPHLPAFNLTFILLVISSVIALIAENSGRRARRRAYRPDPCGSSRMTSAGSLSSRRPWNRG